MGITLAEMAGVWNLNLAGGKVGCKQFGGLPHGWRQSDFRFTAQGQARLVRPLEPAANGGYTVGMDMPLHIDVAALDQAHRRAMEDVLGRTLRSNERLIIQVAATDADESPSAPRAVLDLLTHFYDGMSEAEVEDIDREIKIRANLSRPLP